MARAPAHRTRRPRHLSSRAPLPAPAGSAVRGLFLAAVLAAVFTALLACGSDSSTEPRNPLPDLSGTWTGNLTGEDSAGRFACALDLELERSGTSGSEFTGTWHVDCPDRLNGSPDIGGGEISVGSQSFATAELFADPGDALDGCGWLGLAFLQGVTAFDGSWDTVDCGSGLAGGDLELRRVSS